ncbi:hypothetical protein EJB05_40324, partial [Eragrostis curvula]
MHRCEAARGSTSNAAARRPSARLGQRDAISSDTIASSEHAKAFGEVAARSHIVLQSDRMHARQQPQAKMRKRSVRW